MLDIVKQLTETEMSRKQFLQRIGLAALLITGLPALLKALNENHHSQPTNNRVKGYGSSPYGN